MYHIRIDTSLDNSLVSRLVETTTSCCWVAEKADTNPHVHMYACTDTSLSTIRSWINKAGFKGNKSYSISQCRDKVKLLAYLHKEGKPSYKNIPEEDIASALAYDLSVKEDIKSKKTRNVLQGIYKLLDPRQLEHPEYYTDQIKQAIIQYHLDNELLIRKFQVRTYFDTIMTRSDPKYGLSLFE